MTDFKPIPRKCQECADYYTDKIQENTKLTLDSVTEATNLRVENIGFRANTRIALEYYDKFCREQCDEGPEWGECEESGCNLFFIKKALTPLSNKEEVKKDG